MAVETRKVAFCEMCESISVPSCIGDDCDCEDGFYEEFLEYDCPAEDPNECKHDAHHYGEGTHITLPQDFDPNEFT